ncbi:Uncharacterized protein FWK35_00018304 [Aphis craccivora]|uniref:Uncharacterized protein n=1 Tax=Aphis craccivora TaxID=307492 RepID=A0A6G0ZF76_APHCR|nr:Uncharacterized protein FWK35_00018304 [Aphis craccivora]
MYLRHSSVAGWCGGSTCRPYPPFANTTGPKTPPSRHFHRAGIEKKTVQSGYINPLSSPPPPPPRTTTGPERGRPIRIASATPRTPRQIRDETRGSVKMYFAPPAVDDDDDDYCACARKRGTRSAQRRPILSTAQLPAATTSAALASVSVTTVHTAAAGRARAYDSPDLKLTTPSPSGRANDARALINDLSLLRSLTSIHSSLLLLPAACVYLYIIYATRTPPSRQTIPCPTLSPLTRRYPPAPPQLCRFFLPPPPPPSEKPLAQRKILAECRRQPAARPFRPSSGPAGRSVGFARTEHERFPWLVFALLLHCSSSSSSSSSSSYSSASAESPTTLHGR